MVPNIIEFNLSEIKICLLERCEIFTCLISLDVYFRELCKYRMTYDMVAELN